MAGVPVAPAGRPRSKVVAAPAVLVAPGLRASRAGRVVQAARRRSTRQARPAEPAAPVQGSLPMSLRACRNPPSRRPRPRLEDTGAAALSTGDLALIDEELSEHARWGGALGEVGEAASPDRAEFIANQVSSGMGDAAVQGFGMGILVSGGTKLAERYAGKFVPIPAVGAIIGGVMAGAAMWDAYENWDKPGGGAESLGNIGEGASGYEVAANTIQGIVTILDLAANLLDIIAGISGIVAAAGAVAILASLGTLAPVLGPIAATATKIALTISIVTGIMNIIKMALSPLVMLFRALHTFYSEADPREVEAQGAGLARAGSDLGGTVGGLAGAMATEKAAGQLGDPPPAGSHVDDLDPSAPRDTGPEVEIDPASGPGRTGGDTEAPGTIDVGDVEGAPRLELDTEGVPRPSSEAEANPFHDLTEAEIDAAVGTNPLAGASDAEINALVSNIGAEGEAPRPMQMDLSYPSGPEGPFRYEGFEAGTQKPAYPLADLSDAEIDAHLAGLDALGSGEAPPPGAGVGEFQGVKREAMAVADPAAHAAEQRARAEAGEPPLPPYRDKLAPPGPAAFGSEAVPPGGPAPGTGYHGAMGRTGEVPKGHPARLRQDRRPRKCLLPGRDLRCHRGRANPRRESR